MTSAEAVKLYKRRLHRIKVYLAGAPGRRWCDAPVLKSGSDSLSDLRNRHMNLQDNEYCLNTLFSGSDVSFYDSYDLHASYPKEKAGFPRP